LFWSEWTELFQQRLSVFEFSVKKLHKQIQQILDIQQRIQLSQQNENKCQLKVFKTIKFSTTSLESKAVPWPRTTS
jgi:hypothetical protein